MTETNRTLSDEIVLVGLSGGIDSSAAGLLARERWPDLPFAALHQNLGWDDPDAEDDARQVADAIEAKCFRVLVHHELARPACRQCALPVRCAAQLLDSPQHSRLCLLL